MDSSAQRNPWTLARLEQDLKRVGRDLRRKVAGGGVQNLTPGSYGSTPLPLGAPRASMRSKHLTPDHPAPEMEIAVGTHAHILPGVLQPLPSGKDPRRRNEKTLSRREPATDGEPVRAPALGLSEGTAIEAWTGAWIRRRRRYSAGGA